MIKPKGGRRKFTTERPQPHPRKTNLKQEGKLTLHDTPSPPTKSLLTDCSQH